MPASNISSQASGSRPLFLLGAGFNCDAREEVARFCGNSYDLPPDCHYPLVSDLWRICFPGQTPTLDESIEERFADSIKRGEDKQRAKNDPVLTLVKKLEEADHYIASKLADPKVESCYSRFFDHFLGAHFLTFNYDSLPEIILLHRERWLPSDGYGVPVEVSRYPASGWPPQSRSNSLVVHLHGSLCVYSDEIMFKRKGEDLTKWLSERAEPIFMFDPGPVGSSFSPFGRCIGINRDEPAEQIIAPVPDKSEGLKRVFVQRMYERAREFVASSNVLVAIGYGFSTNDKSSYVPILSALAKAPRPRLVIVAPNADQIATGLKGQFPQIEIEALKQSFKEWVDASFPGIGTTAA